MKKIIYMYLLLSLIIINILLNINCVHYKEIVKGIYYNDICFKKSNLIHLTFDDGLQRSTIKTLNVLKKYKIKATFFILGYSINKYTKKIALRIIAEGHTIGNHSYHHHNFSRGKYHRNNKNSVQNIVYNLKLMENRLNKYLGFKYKIKYFRPPFGERGRGDMICPGNVDYACRELGYYNILWNITSNDIFMNYNPEGKYKHLYQTSQQILKRMNWLIKYKKGGVILFHDYPRTGKILNRIILIIKKYNIKFVTLNEMMKYKYKKRNN